MVRYTFLALFCAVSASAFVTPPVQRPFTGRTVVNAEALLSNDKESLDKVLEKQLIYEAGAADTDLAKRFGHLVGNEVKTVGEAFAEFTAELNSPVNPLYKSFVTDIVGSTHLIIVTARFKKDPIWSVGILAALDLLLRNYPERDIAERIASSFFKSLGLDEAEIRAEAKRIEDWVQDKRKDEVTSALKGEGDSEVAQIAKAIKDDEFWMYSRYFGIGMVRMMEIIGIEMTADDAYGVIEEWMGTGLDKPPYTACSDSDLFFKIKNKVEMMETMMKEIEIREKKRMAERLEERAEAAIRKAERDAKIEAEIAADEALKNEESK